MGLTAAGRSRPRLGHGRAAGAEAKLQAERESESEAQGECGEEALRGRGRHVNGDGPPLPRLLPRDVLIQVLSAQPRVT